MPTIVPFVGIARGQVFGVGATLYDDRKREVAHVSAHIEDGKPIVRGTYKMSHGSRAHEPIQVSLDVASSEINTGDCERWIQLHEAELMDEAKRRGSAERAWSRLDTAARNTIRRDSRLWDHQWDVVDLAWHIEHPTWLPLHERLNAA